MCKVFHVATSRKKYGAGTQNRVISSLRKVILGLLGFLKFEQCCRSVRENLIFLTLQVINLNIGVCGFLVLLHCPFSFLELSFLK